jgi:hypothetical protein
MEAGGRAGVGLRWRLRSGSARLSSSGPASPVLVAVGGGAVARRSGWVLVCRGGGPGRCGRRRLRGGRRPWCVLSASLGRVGGVGAAAGGVGEGEAPLS